MLHTHTISGDIVHSILSWKVAEVSTVHSNEPVPTCASSHSTTMARNDSITLPPSGNLQSTQSTFQTEGSNPSDWMDSDRLAKMGYKSELKRNLSIWSLLGFGFSVSNSWWGASASLAASVLSGGPVLMIYGLILLGIISTAVGASLAELASAMPNSGGQYYWTSQLAPRRHAPLLAFLTGSLNWAGSIFASSSVALSLGASLVGLYALGHPGFVISPWMTFLAYQLVNLFGLLFNCFHGCLPVVSVFSLYISIIGWIVTTIVVPAVSKTKQPAIFVFATFINQTGWNNNTIAFIVGLISPSWCFGALDVATHLAEEIRQPERMIPKSIMSAVAIGLVTSLTYSIAMFFSISDYQAVVGSLTGVPILELYYQTTGSFAATVMLHLLFILAGFGCFIACHTWQARLAWSFSRDGGLPGSKYWSVVHPVAGVPINAHLMSCAWVAILGCLYLASTTAFNSLITGCITFLYLSYSIPVLCLLVRGRSNIRHGPFWLGHAGLVANVVLLGWTLFSLVFFSFPFVMPVSPGNMNYVSVVVVGYGLYLCVYWYFIGRYRFRVPEIDENRPINDTPDTKPLEYS